MVTEVQKLLLSIPVREVTIHVPRVSIHAVAALTFHPFSIDFFQKYNAVLNHKDGTLGLKNQDHSVTVRFNKNQIIIPSRCEVIQHVPTAYGTHRECVLLTKQLHKGLYTVGVIAKPTCGLIPIRMLNTTDEPVRVDITHLDIHSSNQ